MKKVLCKVLAMSLASAMLLSTTALAAPVLKASKEGTTLKVTVTGLSASEESTLLAVKAGTALSTLEANETAIFYIDQTTATADGTASYEFSIDGASDLDVYSGYENMAADAKPMKEAVKQDGGDTPTPGEFIYGDVNNDTVINASDASLVINYILKPTAVKFIDSGTGEEYKYGIQAANVDGNLDGDGNHVINASDASLIINRILKGSAVEFPAEKSSK